MNVIVMYYVIREVVVWVNKLLLVFLFLVIEDWLLNRCLSHLCFKQPGGLLREVMDESWI